jgi:transcriptional regulator with XRE-family HTH domain
MGDESPGAMIRRGRQEARLSQADLAAQLDVHKGTVGDWERNKYFPERHYLLLNKLLHITLRAPGEAERGPGSTIPPDVLAVIRRNYSPKRQREVIEMLEAIEREQRGEAQPHPERDAG